MDNLLKEAIADAKAVRETALANAKIALEEAFTPHLKSMLSKKLQAEMEGEDEDKKDEAIEEGDDEDDMKEAEDKEDDMKEELKPSGIGASDNKEPDAAAMDTSKIGQGPESEGSDSEMGAELDDYEKAPDQAMGENTDLNEEEDEDEKNEGMHDDEDKKDESIDEDLEEALRQLEAEMAEGGHEEDEKEEGYGSMNAEEDPEKDEMYGKMNAEEDPEKDEELDLEAIIKALTNEEEDEEEKDEGMHDDEEKDEAMVPAAELEEYKQTVEYLREKLQEVNLLNAKLLYTNKLFRSRNVSEAQKMKVIEQFDRAANVREVKLVYTTFAESMERVAVNESARKVSQASKPVASTKPSKPIINEETDFRTRMKKLANIL